MLKSRFYYHRQPIATIYETDLKQDKDGTWYRCVGKKKGTKQKFRLGRQKIEAKRRLQDRQPGYGHLFRRRSQIFLQRIRCLANCRYPS